MWRLLGLCVPAEHCTCATGCAFPEPAGRCLRADLSLPQGRRDGVDDRTGEQMACFKAALKGINAWYGNPKTHVLLVTTPLPTGATYTNVQPYEGRGWYCAHGRSMPLSTPLLKLLRAGC